MEAQHIQLINMVFFFLNILKCPTVTLHPFPYLRGFQRIWKQGLQSYLKKKLKSRKIQLVAWCPKSALPKSQNWVSEFLTLPHGVVFPGCPVFSLPSPNLKYKPLRCSFPHMISHKGLCALLTSNKSFSEVFPSPRGQIR